MSTRKWDNPAIKAELERRGYTLTRLALESGLHESACRRALSSSCHAGAMAIARTLDVPIEELFPGRYIRRPRPEPLPKKSTGASQIRDGRADKGVAA